jgi:bifunctional UDP-N-acetylglucosamine pyrophosphorylase/glucosamine-1-phosphate N-acetyltransferase
MEYESVRPLTKEFLVEEKDIFELICDRDLIDRWKGRTLAAVVPAAGTGSRLGMSIPKSLCEVDKVPVLHRIIECLDIVGIKSVVVVNPRTKDEIARSLAEGELNPEFVVQYHPHGMGHAVLMAEPLVEECDDVIVIWGDMPVVRYETLIRTYFFHCLFSDQVTATVPTVTKSNPYIAIERDADGRLTTVRQARVGSVMPEHGESDCGVFIVKRQALFDALRRMYAQHTEMKGDKSDSLVDGQREFTFLPVLEELQREGAQVLCLSLASVAESWSINTRDDLAVADRFYREELWQG